MNKLLNPLTEDTTLLIPPELEEYYNSIEFDIDRLIKDKDYRELNMEQRVDAIVYMVICSNLHVSEYIWDCFNGDLNLFVYEDYVSLEGEDKLVSAEEIAYRLCKCKCDEDIWDLMLKGVGDIWQMLSLYRGVIKFDPEFPVSVGEVAASPERACRFATYIRDHGGPDYVWALQYDENNNLIEVPF